MEPTAALERIATAMALVEDRRFPAGPISRRQIGVWSARTCRHLVAADWTECGRRAPSVDRVTFRSAFADTTKPLCSRCAAALCKKVHYADTTGNPSAVVAKWLQAADRAQRAWVALDSAETMFDLRAAIDYADELEAPDRLRRRFGDRDGTAIANVADRITAEAERRLSEVAADPTPVRTVWANRLAPRLSDTSGVELVDRLPALAGVCSGHDDDPFDVDAVAFRVQGILTEPIEDDPCGGLAKLSEWLTPTTDPCEHPATWLARELEATSARIATALVARRRDAVGELIADTEPTCSVVVVRPWLQGASHDVGASIHDIVERRQVATMGRHVYVCAVDRLEAGWLASVSNNRCMVVTLDGVADVDHLRAFAALGADLRPPNAGAASDVIRDYRRRVAAIWDQAGAVAA